MNAITTLPTRAATEAPSIQTRAGRSSDRHLPPIIGSSPALRTVLDQVRQVAMTDATVLVMGETGTGKELIARTIHASSRRCGQTLIKLSCAALAPTLVESELFGHERGAFTGATGRRIGRFELASRGTLFLDEIGELPVETQAKLLRVLQDGEFERVGGSTTIRSDTRVVAATNRALEQDVAGGRFRADLFYRLHVFPIRMPPLRQRRQDIPLLTTHFVEACSRRLAKSLTGVTPDSLDRLLAHDWPGNIRELQHVIERACILSGGPLVHVATTMLASPPANPFAARTTPDTPLLPLDEMERSHIRRVLKATDGRIGGAGGAAEILRLHPNTLRSRMRRLGLRTSRAVAP